MTKHMLQTYVHAPEWADYHTKEDFLVSAAYYPNGDLTKDPVDTMFDTFIFLPSPGFHHDHVYPDQYSGCKRFNREMIEEYYEVQFDETRNMGALEAATAEIKEKLGLPDYQTEVYLPYFNMLPTAGIFGMNDKQVFDAELLKKEDGTVLPLAYAKDYHDFNNFTACVKVLPGMTYRFSILYRPMCEDVQGNCSFSLQGSAVGEPRSLIRGYEPMELDGLTYDTESGLLTYTFTAMGSQLILSLNSDADWKFCETYVAVPKLEQLDENGCVIATVDCDPEFKEKWKTGWGTPFRVSKVKGRVLDMGRKGDRFGAVEWQINEQIRRMKKYKHVKLAGFFYVTEGVIREEEDILPTVKHANEYAVKLGYETHWNPYNHIETGYYRWKELGFTSCSQQINYFPPVVHEDGTWQEQMNSQKKEAIEETARRTELYGIDITMEWSCLGGKSCGWRYFKEYMEGGILYGYMTRPHVNYQLDGGPRSVHSVASALPYFIGNETNGIPPEEYERRCRTMDIPEIRSLYGELYRFIKGTLTTKDIYWGKRSHGSEYPKKNKEQTKG